MESKRADTPEAAIDPTLRAGAGYRAESAEILEAALRSLASRFRLADGEPRSDAMTFLDTFDWRLFRAGLTLTSRSRGKQTLLHLTGGDGPDFTDLSPTGDPALTADLPEGPIRANLERVLEMRALLPVVSLADRDQRFNVLDGREKTVVRVALRTGEASAGDATGAIAPLLLLIPVRGYDKQLAAVRAHLEEQVGLVRSDQATLAAALEAVNRHPGDYTGKLKLSLSPGQRADEAARTIYRALLDTIRRNEEGTIADTDSEFLHDFRVAVRRTRSALSQIREVFPEEEVARFKEDFRWLGQVTGPTRDLDVYLLKLPGYAEFLPPDARGDLDPLQEFLERSQREEQDQLARALASERYRELLAEWSDFLSAPPPARPTAANARRPIAEVASESIWRCWRRLLKKGGRIDDDSPREDLHRLRIDAKKLRYLLTFFQSLYPAETIDALVGSLKKLQDNLGDFNDYGVQQAAMKTFAETMLAEGAPVMTIMAMGRLVEQLEIGESKERGRFKARFKEFTVGRNRKLFRDLFGPRERGEDGA